MSKQAKLQELDNLFKDQNLDQNSISQIYKSINYKIAQPNSNGIQLSVDEIKQQLKPNRPGADDINTYTEDEINKILLKQSYILNSGYFDLQNVFPKIEVKSLDDEDFDSKILTMLTQNRFN